MALSPTTVATAIAALSVTGVTVKDLTGVPDEVQDRDCPIVYPSPENFVSMSGVERLTIGGDASALKEVTYQLHYIYLHRRVASERGLKDKAQGAVSKLYTFISAVISNCDTLTVVDIAPEHGPLGAMTDAAGNQFHGCDITLTVKEWLNP